VAALGRPDAALEQWREVLQRAPADATAHYKRGAQLLLSRTATWKQAARHEADARAPIRKCVPKGVHTAAVGP
jgi:hypothetical protein